MEETSNLRRMCCTVGCEQRCEGRFCNKCTKAYKATLTKNCDSKGCEIKVQPDASYCTRCLKHANQPEPPKCACGQTLHRKGVTQCTDCRSDAAAAARELSLIKIMDRQCETCSKACAARWCEECTATFRATLRLCADCCKVETTGIYCEACIIKYNANKKRGVCQGEGCNYSIPSDWRFCKRCINEYKSKAPHKCFNEGCSGETKETYCRSCTAAHKAAKQKMFH